MLVRKRHLSQVLLTPSHPLLNCGKIFFQHFPGSFPFSFVFLSTWSFSSLLLFSYTPSFVFVLVCVCKYSYCMRAHRLCHKFPRRPLPPPTVSVCWDGGCPLIFKHSLIQIQKLVFPLLRGGSHWDTFGTAHDANKASFMNAANNLCRNQWRSVWCKKC